MRTEFIKTLSEEFPDYVDEFTIINITDEDMWYAVLALHKASARDNILRVPGPERRLGLLGGQPVVKATLVYRFANQVHILPEEELT